MHPVSTKVNNPKAGKGGLGFHVHPTLDMYMVRVIFVDSKIKSLPQLQKNLDRGIGSKGPKLRNPDRFGGSFSGLEENAPSRFCLPLPDLI
jgi:hypothetical protein